MAVPTQAELAELTDEQVLELLHAYRDEYDRRAGGDLLSKLRACLAESDELEAGDVPVKVIFHSSSYDNGWFYSGSARVHLKGEDEPIDLYFEDDDRLESLLADHSDSAGERTHLIVDLMLDSIDDEGCCCWR